MGEKNYVFTDQVKKKKDGTLGAVTPKRVIEDLLLFHESPLKTHLPLFSDIQ